MEHQRRPSGAATSPGASSGNPGVRHELRSGPDEFSHARSSQSRRHKAGSSGAGRSRPKRAFHEGKVAPTLLYLGGNPSRPSLHMASGCILPGRSRPTSGGWPPNGIRNMNDLRPDQVRRASAREVVWRCELGHRSAAAFHKLTLSGSGHPGHYGLEAAERSQVGRQRAWMARERAA